MAPRVYPASNNSRCKSDIQWEELGAIGCYNITSQRIRDPSCPPAGYPEIGYVVTSPHKRKDAFRLFFFS
jgi:hypothetical protein